MENETMNLDEEFVETTEQPCCEEELDATVIDSIASEDEAESEEEETVETAKEKLLRKCGELKDSCRNTADRIAKDLKECDYNPYFKQTRTYKLEVYRNCNEETPIDVYETTDVKSFSARALAVAGTAAMLVAFATNCAIKKILK